MVGQRIKELREGQVIGQAELARAAGVSVNTIWRIEAGKVLPQPRTIRKIAAALGVSPQELVNG